MKAFIPLVWKSLPKILPQLFYTSTRRSGFLCKFLCMGAMHPCLYLLSNVSKERQPVKKKKKHRQHISYQFSSQRDAWRVEPLLQGGFIFKFTELHALLQQPRPAYMRNLKGCVHVSFLPQLPGKERGECCFTTNSEVTNWIWASPRVALVD